MSTIRRAFLGALLGACVAGTIAWLGQALLFGSDIIRPAAQEHLELVAPSVIGWLVAFGALLGARGPMVLHRVEEDLLPEWARTRGPRDLFRLLLCMAVLAVLHYYVARFLMRWPTDLPTFLLASRAIEAGADPYTLDNLAGFTSREIPGGELHPYLYLPLFAVLIRPLAWLSLPAAHVVVMLTNVLLWLVLVYQSLRVVEAPERLKAPLLALSTLLLVSFLPTVQTLHHGSPSLLVAVLIVSALLYDREGRERRAGAFLALAAMIKIVPFLLVPLLLIRTRWRTLKWMALSAAVLLAISVLGAGLELHLRWLSEVAPPLVASAETGTWFEPACHEHNQSLTGFACRALGEESAARGPLVKLLSLALLASLGFALWRRRARGALDGLEISLCLCFLLLVSTITWFHHFTLLLPALLWLWVFAVSRERALWRAVLGLFALVATVVVGFEFLLDPWPFVGPSLPTRASRFFALAGTTLLLLLAAFGIIGTKRGDQTSRR